MRTKKIHWLAALVLALGLCMVTVGALADFTLAVGENRKLVCNYYYRTKEFDWVTGDTSIASIGRYNSRETTITGKSAGQTYYKCYYYYYKLVSVGSQIKDQEYSVSYSEKVTVKPAPYAVTFEKKEIVLPIGYTISLQAPTYYPAGSGCYLKIWSNSNAAVAKINTNSHEITGIAEGETFVSITLFNNVTASYKIKVIPPPLAITSVSTNTTTQYVNGALFYNINATGGKGTKSYRIVLLKDGKQIVDTNYTANSRLDYKLVAPGVYQAKCYVKDDTGTVTVDTATNDVKVQALNMTSCTASANAPCVGTPITFTAYPYYGMGDYSYQFAIYCNDALVKTVQQSTSQYVYAPLAKGTYYAIATVTCGSEQVSLQSNSRQVTNDALSLTITTPADCNADTQPLWTWEANGGYGTRTYSYALIWNGKEATPTDFAAERTSLMTFFTFKEPSVRIAVRATVKDASGEASATSGEVVVTRTPTEIVITPSQTQPSETSKSLTWTVTTKGGLVNKQLYYKLYNGSKVVNTPEWVTSKTFTYTPTQEGNYALSVTVRDDSGVNGSKTSPVQVVYWGLQAPTLVETVKTSGVNVPVSWTAESLGGYGKKQYQFQVKYGVNSNASTTGEVVYTSEWSSDPKFTYTPTQLGWYVARAWVKDDTATTRNSLYYYSVRVVPAVTLNSVASESQTVYAGTPITWKASTSNGWGTKTFTGKVYCGSEVVETLKGTTENTSNLSVEVEKPLEFTPSKPGTYALSVTVKDASGAQTKTSATVKVQAVPITLNSVTTPNATAGVGATVTWTTDATGGTGGLRYSYQLYRGSEVIDTVADSAEPTYTYVPDAEAAYALSVTVKDGYSKQSKTSAVLRVIPTPLAAPTVTVDRQSAATGDQVSWKVSPVGGFGSKAYYYQLYCGNTVVNKPEWVASASFTYPVELAGNYALRVSVKDDQSTVVKVSPVIAVVEAPLQLQAVAADTETADTATTITWNVASEGGVGKKQYSYKLYCGSAVLSTSDWADNSTFTYTPTDAGNYALKVTVKDSKGSKALTSKVLRVSAAPLSVTAVQADAADCAAGVPITWNVSLTGGTGAKLYQYKLYEGAKIVNTPAWVSDASFTYTGKVSASVALSVPVEDASGSASKVSAVTKVTAPLSVSSVTPSTVACVAGTSVTWTVTAENGAGNRWYRYQLYKGNSVINTPAWVKDATFTAVLSDPASYALSISVKDSTGSVSKVSAVTRVTTATVVSNTVSIGK